MMQEIEGFFIFSHEKRMARHGLVPSYPFLLSLENAVHECFIVHKYRSVIPGEYVH